jgi:ELWxxDGT repeat protein
MKFSRNRFRRTPKLSVEQLESRYVLSAPQVIDLNTEPLGSGPDVIASVSDEVLFGYDGQLWRLPADGEATVIVDDLSSTAKQLGTVGGRLLYQSGGVQSYDPATHQSTLIIPIGSSASTPIAWGQFLIFATSKEVWRTDGTLEGTSKVLTSTTSLFAGYWTELGDSLIFSANDGVRGSELWRLDSSGPAQLLKDIQPGSSPSYPTHLVAAGKWIYFTANDGEHGAELWRTDGTSDNTMMVKEFYPGATFIAGPDGLTVLGNYLYYAASTVTHGRELHRTHIETGETTLVADVRTGTAPDGTQWGSEPSYLLSHNGSLYFRAVTALGNWTPFKYDPHTGSVVNLAPGRSWSEIRFYAADESLYMLAANRESPNSSYINWELLISDGTVSGTFAAAIPQQNNNTSWPTIYNDGPDGITVVFHRLTNLTAFLDIWRADSNGAVYVSEVPSYFEVEGHRLGTYRLLKLSFSTLEQGELWAIDLRDNSLAILGGLHRDTTIVELAGRVYYNGWDANTGFELWSSDGTLSGTDIVVDLDFRTADSRLHYGATGRTKVVFRDELYFGMTVGRQSAELWATDGSVEGSRRVAETGTQALGEMIVFRDSMYFIGGRPSIVGNVSQLWRVGPNGVAQMMEGITAGTLFKQGEALYLRGTVNGVTGLYRNDGSGFQLILEAYKVGGANGGFGSVYERDGRIYFHYGNIYGETLYVYDIATLTNTILTTAIGIGWFQKHSDGLIFSKRNSNVSDWQMWYTDGTVEGTRPLSEFLPEYESSHTYTRLFTYGGMEYFRIESSGLGSELFRNDGNVGTVELVADIRSGPASSFPSQPARLGDRVIFTADDGIHGREWWVIDFPNASPRLLKDIFPGGTSGLSSSVPIAVIGDVAYFTGYDPEHGVELWQTDGTTAGTRLVHDIRRGPTSSEIRELAAMGNRLFFQARDDVYGMEWRVLTPDSLGLPGDYDGNGVVDTNDYSVWKTNFGATSGPGLAADGNNDGHVNLADYTIWRDNLGAQLVPPSPASFIAPVVELETPAIATSAPVDSSQSVLRNPPWPTDELGLQSSGRRVLGSASQASTGPAYASNDPHLLLVHSRLNLTSDFSPTKVIPPMPSSEPAIRQAFALLAERGALETDFEGPMLELA